MSKKTSAVRQSSRVPNIAAELIWEIEQLCEAEGCRDTTVQHQTLANVAALEGLDFEASAEAMRAVDDRGVAFEKILSICCETVTEHIVKFPVDERVERTLGDKALALRLLGLVRLTELPRKDAAECVAVVEAAIRKPHQQLIVAAAQTVLKYARSSQWSMADMMDTQTLYVRMVARELYQLAWYQGLDRTSQHACGQSAVLALSRRFRASKAGRRAA